MRNKIFFLFIFFVLISPVYAEQISSENFNTDIVIDDGGSNVDDLTSPRFKSAVAIGQGVFGDWTDNKESSVNYISCYGILCSIKDTRRTVVDDGAGGGAAPPEEEVPVEEPEVPMRGGVCGDDVCGGGESLFSCYQDCMPRFDWGKYLLIFLGLFGLGLLVFGRIWFKMIYEPVSSLQIVTVFFLGEKLSRIIWHPIKSLKYSIEWLYREFIEE